MSITYTRLEGNPPDMVRVEHGEPPHPAYSNELDRWPMKRTPICGDCKKFIWLGECGCDKQKSKGEAA